LLEMRDAQAHGELDIKMESTTFRLSDHRSFLADNAADITTFRTTQQAAFETERQQWERDGEFSR